MHDHPGALLKGAATPSSSPMGALRSSIIIQAIRLLFNDILTREGIWRKPSAPCVFIFHGKFPTIQKRWLGILSRFSHKNILLYGDCQEYPRLCYKDVFREIAGLRTSFEAVRNSIDAYVTLILGSASSAWREEIGRSGAEYFRAIEKQINRLLSLPDGSAAESETKIDILPGLLLSSSGGNYFENAWKEYSAGTLEERFPVYFDLPSAGRLRHEISAVAGEKNANNIFIMLWNTFYSCSYHEVFLKSFLDGITSSLLSVEPDTANRVWQVWLDNF